MAELKRSGRDRRGARDHRFHGLIATAFGALPLVVGGCLRVWDGPAGAESQLWAAAAGFRRGWGWADRNSLTAAGLAAIGLGTGGAMYRAWGRTGRPDQAEDYEEGPG